MWAVGLEVPHLFGIAMVGGHDQTATAGERRLDDPADALVDLLTSSDRGIKVAGVSDHIAVGEVHHDKPFASIRGESFEYR